MLSLNPMRSLFSYLRPSPFVQDPVLFEDIPDDAIKIMLRCLNYKDLRTCCRLDKRMNLLISEDQFLTKQAIFNSTAQLWNQVFGEGTVSENELEKALTSLPNDIHKTLTEPCKVFANKRTGDTHFLFYIPEKVKDKILNLDNFDELLKKINGFTEKGSWFQETFHFGRHHYSVNCIGKKVIKTGWVLMMHKFLPGCFDYQTKNRQ